MEMGMTVVQPGALTTVQDGGRTGYMQFGFSPSGALDRRAMELANLLVGNQRDEAILEATLMGPTLQFDVDTVIALAGGDFGAQINGRPVPLYQALPVKTGDTLQMGFAKTGCRATIAFAGGLDLPAVMGSRSTNLKCGIGGLDGRKLQAGDRVGFAHPRAGLPNMDSRKLEPVDCSQKAVTLRVIPGMQEDAFTAAGRRTFFAAEYTVTNQNDRMGCRLDGPAVEHKNGADIISDGIPLGAVQVPENGKPIVLLSDRQTTGGYTKIGAVFSLDLPLLVQRKLGDKVRFAEISADEAHDLLKQDSKRMKKLEKQLKR